MFANHSSCHLDQLMTLMGLLGDWPRGDKVLVLSMLAGAHNRRAFRWAYSQVQAGYWVPTDLGQLLLRSSTMSLGSAHGAATEKTLSDTVH